MVAKTDKSVWVQVESIYKSGAFKSVKELGARFGINNFTLLTRIRREGWKEKREQVLARVSQRVEEKVLSSTEKYLSSLQSRVSKYESIIDASIEHLGSKTDKGIPLMDPEAIDQFTRSEGRLQIIGAFAHRIPTISQTDVTSGGKSLAEGLLGAINSLRDSGKPTVDLTPQQVEYINSLEVTP